MIALGLLVPGIAFAKSAPADRLNNITRLNIDNVESTQPSVKYVAEKEKKKTLDNGIVDDTVNTDEDAMKPNRTVTTFYSFGKGSGGSGGGFSIRYLT